MPENPRIYVGNLAYTATEEDLRAHFEAAGFPVQSVKVIIDRDTNQSRGFAFVELESGEAAQRAVIEMNSSDVAGRPLRLSEAHERPARTFPGGSGRDSGHDGGDRDRGDGGGRDRGGRGRRRDR